MLSCVRKEETNGPEENMNSEVKEVAVKMADYSTMEKKTMLKQIAQSKVATTVVKVLVVFAIILSVFAVIQAFWFNHYYYVTAGNIG